MKLFLLTSGIILSDDLLKIGQWLNLFTSSIIFSDESMDAFEADDESADDTDGGGEDSESSPKTPSEEGECEEDVDDEISIEVDCSEAESFGKPNDVIFSTSSKFKAIVEELKDMNLEDMPEKYKGMVVILKRKFNREVIHFSLYESSAELFENEKVCYIHNNKIQLRNIHTCFYIGFEPIDVKVGMNYDKDDLNDLFALAKRMGLENKFCVKMV